MSYPIHPAANLFPLLVGDKLAELADNIRSQGLLHPIVLYRGAVLDGRNRLAACEVAGVNPRFASWDGPSPTSYVIAANIARRHLTPAQAAAAAAEAAPLFAEEARERQEAAGEHGGKGGRPQKTLGSKRVPRVPEKRDPKGRSAAQAAQAIGAGRRQTEEMSGARKRAPEVVEVAKQGKASVAATVAASKLPEPERAAVIAAVESGASPSIDAALRERRERIAGGGVDALGRALPDEVASAYAEMRAIYDKAAGFARQLVAALGAVPDSWNGHTAAARMREQVQLLGVEIRDMAPATVCPFCKLIPSLRSDCAGCNGIGLVSGRHFKSADPMLQITGAEAVVFVTEDGERVPRRVSEMQS